MTYVLQVWPKGALLIGNGGSANPVLDDETARDEAHPELPVVPASTLRGAIREQAIRLRHAHEDPDENIVAALFGADHPRSREGKVRIGSARIRDAELQRFFATGLGFQMRPAVSIDRRTRRAAHQRFFTREVVAPFVPDLVFEADVDLGELTNDELAYFEGAVRAVFAIGGSRTSGMGGVRLSLQSRPHGDRTRVEPVPDSDTLLVTIETIEPVCLGGRQSPGNAFESLSYVPSTTLRGAVVSAALRHRGITKSLVDEPWFRRLVLDPDTCLRFGDGLPVRSHGRPRHTPLSVRTCKDRGPRHGLVDRVIRDLLRSYLAASGVYVSVDETCPTCTSTTERLGPFLGGASPARRVRTGLRMNPATGKGEEGQLYAIEQLEPGTRFVAPLANVSSEARELLADAMAAGLRLGRGRRRGRGEARITGMRELGGTSLARRIRNLDGVVRQLFAEASETFEALKVDLSAHYLVIAAESDIGLPEDWAGTEPFDIEAGLADLLAIPTAKAAISQIRVARRGGFGLSSTPTRGRRNGGIDWQPKPLRPVIAAGSVLVVTTSEDPSQGAILDRLAVLERHGVGERREEGLGWVRVCDEIHDGQWRTNA